MVLIKDRPSQHWALNYYNEEPTPWLLPPKSKMNNVIFDPTFIEWHGKRWLAKFKKQDIYEAMADFRASLFNDPNRILIRWQEYEAANKHYAGAVLTQSVNPIGIRDRDKQHIIKYQSALVANTVEAPPQKSLKSSQHPAITAAIEQGKIKLIRHFYNGAFTQGVQESSGWFNTEEEWLIQAKRLHGETA